MSAHDPIDPAFYFIFICLHCASAVFPVFRWLYHDSLRCMADSRRKQCHAQHLALHGTEGQ